MSVWLTVKIIAILLLATVSMVARDELLCDDLLRTTLDGSMLECGLSPPYSGSDVGEVP
jgi:hypothetical protein